MNSQLHGQRAIHIYLQRDIFIRLEARLFAAASLYRSPNRSVTLPGCYPSMRDLTLLSW